jgi:FkbM family methyltransferase
MIPPHKKKGDPRRRGPCRENLSDSAKWIIRRFLRRRGYDLVMDPQESQWTHLDTVLRLWEIECALDIGAHCGEFGHRLRTVGFEGRITSVEPVSRSFDLLAGTARSDSKWEVRNFALGSRNGQADINVTELAAFSSLLSPSSFGRTAYPDSQASFLEQVEVHRLDDVWQDLAGDAKRVFLKLDTQGYDLEVLKGASEHLSAVVAMQLELAFKPSYEGAPSFGDALDYVTDLGFEITGFFPVTRERFRLVEADCVLVRAGEGPRSPTPT